MTHLANMYRWPFQEPEHGHSGISFRTDLIMLCALLTGKAKSAVDGAYCDTREDELLTRPSSLRGDACQGATTPVQNP